MTEKTTREEYTLDWSQSKVFLLKLKLNYCDIGDIL